MSHRRPRAALGAASAFVLATFVSPAAHAAPIYDAFAGVTYVLDTTARTWVDANAAAQAAGANLARVRSAGANEAIRAVGGNAWIGATDQGVEGEWRWTVGNAQFWQGLANGSNVGGLYTNWNTGEPNDVGGEDYAQMTTGGGWNDLPSSSTLPSVREVAGNQAAQIFGNSRYTLIAADTWANARLTAKALGGDLVRINDAAENAFVANLLASTGGISAWIGATDEAGEGAWRWAQGDEQFWQGLASNNGGVPVGGLYSNWNGGEPNDSGGEDYAEMLSNGLWNDLPTSFTRVAVVESPVPEPAAVGLVAIAAVATLARRGRR